MKYLNDIVFNLLMLLMKCKNYKLKKMYINYKEYE